MSQPDWVPPQPTRGIVGQITHHLDHLAEMLYAIDEYDELNYYHHRRIAFVDSFLLDFRALYYFLLGPRTAGDAHRYDFVDIMAWQRPKSEATKRADKLVLFISKHRAHLSMNRFVPEYQDLEDLIGVSQITAEFLGQVLLDYLDILDDFIAKLPEGAESGKGFWQGAAYSARYKTEIALGVRESDYPDHFKPLKSVQAQRERVIAEADPSQPDPVTTVRLIPNGRPDEGTTVASQVTFTVEEARAFASLLRRASDRIDAHEEQSQPDRHFSEEIRAAADDLLARAGAEATTSLIGPGASLRTDGG